MIQCKKCGFSVSEMMKHALMKNSCPACGFGLFSSESLNIIASLQQKISSQKFASNFSEKVIYDISLFFFNEITDGIGKIILDKKLLEIKNSKASSEDDETVYTDPEEADELEQIKKEVEDEYKDEIESLRPEEDPDMEEIFSKAERLKRLREQQKLSNPRLSQILDNATDDTSMPSSKPKTGLRRVS